MGRIQKHCLCLQDLIKHTSVDQPDYQALSEALHISQELVTDYNSRHAGGLFSASRTATKTSSEEFIHCGISRRSAKIETFVPLQ